MTKKEQRELKLRLLLTLKEAAEALSISPRKLTELVKNGQISAVRIGRCLRFSDDELRKFVASNSTQQ